MVDEGARAEEKRARLGDIDAQLREAKQDYTQRKRALKEQRQAVLHDWSEEEARERSKYLAARRERIARRRQQRRMLSEPPVRPVLEEVGSSVTHGAGAALAVVAVVVCTLGMIAFVKETRGAHFLWHFFVFFGAVVHWFGIYFFLY